jgi:hypothetical protein
MELRAAVTPEPDYPFARRVALFAGVLTAGVIASTIAVAVHSRHERREMPIPTIVFERAELEHFASFRSDPPDPPPPGAMQLAVTELEAYARLAGGYCPRDLLVVNMAMPALHAIDPWGNPYQTACNTGAVAFRSAGPDRVYDTADDLWR